MKLLLIFAAVLLSAVTAKVPPMSVDQVHKDSKNPSVVDIKMSVVVPPIGPVVVPPVVAPVVAPISAKMTKPMEPAVAVGTPVKVPLVQAPGVVPVASKEPVGKLPVGEVPAVLKVPIVKMEKVPTAPTVPVMMRSRRAIAMPVVVPLPKVTEVPVVTKVPVVSTVPKVPTIPAAVMPAAVPVIAMPTMITKAPVMMRRKRAIVDPVVVPLPGVTQMKIDPLKCDVQCTKLDLNPVCASNGDCLHEFPNQCIMDTFNCVHPDLGFKATKDNRCQMHWLKRCTEQELMG